MDTTMVILRLIHLFAGVYWLGAALFFVFILNPAAKTAGAEGQRFIEHLTMQQRFAMSFPLAAILSTGSGIWLYYRVSGHFDSDWITSKPGLALTIGGIAGLASFIIGGAIHGPTTAKIADLAKAMQSSDAPPSAEQQAELARLLKQESQLSYLSTALLAIALVGMASAQYLYA